MIEHEYADLKARFEALRRVAAADAPSFKAMLAAAQGRGVGEGPASQRHRRLRLAALVGVIAVLALLVTRVGHVERGRVTVDLANVRWHSPTDFLLQLPGDELLRSVPRLGRLTLDGRTL